MGNPLRDRRTPSKLAASGQVIELSDKIGDFERLTAIIEADLAALNPDKLPSDWRDSVVSGQLAFGFTDALGGLQPEGRWPAAEGHVEVMINMVCQRCLEPFELPLAARHVGDAACQEPTEIEAGSDDIIRPFADLKSQMQEES